MRWMCSFLMFLGRVALGSVFIWSAARQILNYHPSIDLIGSKGISLAPLFFIGGILMELIGGIVLILGYRARLGALLLIIYLIPTTLIFHGFWAEPAETTAFFKNVAIFGGLLYVLSCGGGCFCTDSCYHKDVEE